VIDLVVFDLDGTLIDSSRDLADAVNALVVELGGRRLGLDQVTGMVGDGASMLVRRALSAAGLDPETPGALARFLARYDARLTTHTKPYPGIPEALAALADRGLVLAVLTNKPERQTLEILRRLGLASTFPHVIGGDTPAGRKPDPSGLLAIVARSGATPATTMLVGDSPVDLATARRGGTAICLARYGFGYRFEPDAFRGDELFVDAPAELLSRL
jgi:phosphoglycolate phosphatase